MRLAWLIAREQLGLPVVRLDLRGERVPVEAEGGDELARERRPVDLGIGGDVGGEGAGRAAELAEVLDGLDLRELRSSRCDEDGELLADRRGGGGLPVGVGEHRPIRARRGRRSRSAADHVAQPRQPDLADRGADGDRVGEVVDVLARAGEVGELGELG